MGFFDVVNVPISLRIFFCCEVRARMIDQRNGVLVFYDRSPFLSRRFQVQLFDLIGDLDEERGAERIRHLVLERTASDLVSAIQTEQLGSTT